MSDASALVVTFTSVMTAGYSRASNNLEHGASGPFPGDLGMLQTRSDANTSHLRGQRLTISFGRPVFDLQLPLSSFSWPASDAYQDAAWVSPAPTSVAYGSNVTGAGAQSDVFRNPRRGNNPAVPYSGATTTVTLTYAGGGGLSELVVHYFDRAAGTGHTNQGIAVLNMNFKAKRLGCT